MPAPEPEPLPNGTRSYTIILAAKKKALEGLDLPDRPWPWPSVSDALEKDVKSGVGKYVDSSSSWADVLRATGLKGPESQYTLDRGLVPYFGDEVPGVVVRNEEVRRDRSHRSGPAHGRREKELRDPVLQIQQRGYWLTVAICKR